MTEIQPIAETVLRALRGRDLFEFDDEALTELAAFYEQPQALMPEPDPSVIEQARALSHLNAAEFALIPALANPDPGQLPPRSAIRVGVAWTRLALLKGDCSLIIWTHASTGGAGFAPLQAEDVAVFAGDISKSTKLRTRVDFATADDANLAEMVPTLESVHRQSHWPPAQQVADAGVLQLQGLLWTLKRSVVSPDAVRSIQQEVENFGGAIA